ncbi:MAG: zf-HC2 domain-containing protein [Acidobacteria bacterium]|nr:zf-HC2 domain-containing protein [Acidobacteriota bacterium]
MLTTMTCGRARKLMPLHAAGDLARRRARRVAAHVESCDSCRLLAAEFAAARKWARAAAEPPEFGADFYEGLRASVLDEIRRTGRPAAPRRAPLFNALAGRRLAYATSFALALVACALAFNFYSRRAKDAPPSQLATTPAGAVEVATPAPAPAPRGLAPRPTPARDRGRRSPRPRLQLAAGNNPRKTLTMPRRATPEAAGRESSAGASAHPSPRQVAFAAAVSAKTGEIARIEIQTTDPNIRIIWLSPQGRDAPATER